MGNFTSEHFEPVDNNRSDYGASKVKGATSIRGMDELLDSQESQIQYLVETMRRVEDLAERIAGSMPTEASDNTKPTLKHPGYIGALGSQQTDRQIAINRIADAMSRIESFI